MVAAGQTPPLGAGQRGESALASDRETSAASPGRRLMRESQAGRRWLMAALGAGLGASIAGLAFLYLLSVLIAAVFIDGQTLAASVSLAAVMFLALVSRSILLFAREPMAQRAANCTKQSLRGRLLRHLQMLGPSYTQSQRSGELVNTVVGGVEAVDGFIARYEPARIQAMIVPVLVVLIILWLDPWSTLVLLFAGPVLVLLMVFIGQRTRALTERRFADLSWMSGYFLDMLRGLPTMKAFGRSKEQADNIASISAEFGRTTMDVLRTAFQTSLVLEWGATAATAMVAVEVSLRLMAGVLPFSTALAVLLLTPEFFQPLRQLALHYHAGSDGKAAARRIYAILDEQPASAHAEVNERARLSNAPAISFEHVTVCYGNERRPSLTDVSLTLAAGQTVALIGSTGAGKSTMAHALLRFVEPASGRILVDGQPLSEIDPAEWRASVGWVSQTPHLFSGSVADNLRLARLDASDAEVEAAAHAANAHEFIMALPAGYETDVGEEGAKLSGGQRQRLAIARAFLKNAPLIILDEATAHLDSASESAVWDAVERLKVGRTTLMIVHNRQLAQRADLVAVVEAGRVFALGKPGDLSVATELNGQYHDAIALKA